MLRKLRKQEFKKYVLWAYELAINPEKFSFPSYCDGIKTKEDFINTAKNNFSSESGEILLYEKDNTVFGYIDYYVIERDKYISFNVINFEDYVEQGLDELIDYINAKYNYDIIDFGFNKKNTTAIYFLEKITDIKFESYVNIISTENFEFFSEDENIVKVTFDNFNDFKLLHDKKTDMYWNSDRLYEQLDNDKWNLYMYYKNNKAIASIYFVYTSLMMEIFGLDFYDDMLSKSIFKKLITKSFNETKRKQIKYITMFCDTMLEKELLESLGMKCNLEYVNYRVKNKKI